MQIRNRILLGLGIFNLGMVFINLFILIYTKKIDAFYLALINLFIASIIMPCSLDGKK